MSESSEASYVSVTCHAISPYETPTRLAVAVATRESPPKRGDDGSESVMPDRVRAPWAGDARSSTVPATAASRVCVPS